MEQSNAYCNPLPTTRRRDELLSASSMSNSTRNLIVTDIKHALFTNPPHPAYVPA